MTQKFAYSINDKVIQLTPVNNEELGYEIIFKASENTTEIKPDISNDIKEDYVSFKSEQWSATLDNMIAQLPIMQCASTHYEGTIRAQGDTIKYQHENQIVAEYKKFFAFKINDITEAQKELDIMKAHLQNSLQAIDKYVLFQLLDKLIVIGRKALCAYDLHTMYLEGVLDDIYAQYKDKIHVGEHPWVWVSNYVYQKIARICAMPGALSRKGAVASYKNLDIMVLDNDIYDAGEHKLLQQDIIIHGLNKGLSICGNVQKMESLRDRDSFSDLVRGIYLFGIDINTEYFKICKLHNL